MVRFAHIRQLNRGAHWRTPHMLSCLLVQTIGSSEIYFRVFLSRHLHIRCALGHTVYQFCGYWMLWNKMDDFSRMNDCDVFSSLTLTACAVMRF